MTDHQRYILISEAQSDADREAFVSDWALSSMWGEDADLAHTAEQCGKAWDAVHKPLSEIRAAMGLTQVQMAERLCVSRRTYENWEYRDCPIYVRVLVARVWVGLE